MSGTGDIVQSEWLDADGTPISCREKLRVLAENDDELRQVLRDAFEDAVLMGVDPVRLRARLHDAVDRLVDPRRR